MNIKCYEDILYKLKQYYNDAPFFEVDLNGSELNLDLISEVKNYNEKFTKDSKLKNLISQFLDKIKEDDIKKIVEEINNFEEFINNTNQDNELSIFFDIIILTTQNTHSFNQLNWVTEELNSLREFNTSTSIKLKEKIQNFFDNKDILGPSNIQNTSENHHNSKLYKNYYMTKNYYEIKDLYYDIEEIIYSDFMEDDIDNVEDLLSNHNNGLLDSLKAFLKGNNSKNYDYNKFHILSNNIQFGTMLNDSDNEFLKDMIVEATEIYSKSDKTSFYDNMITIFNSVLSILTIGFYTPENKEYIEPNGKIKELLDKIDEIKKLVPGFSYKHDYTNIQIKIEYEHSNTNEMQKIVENAKKEGRFHMK